MSVRPLTFSYPMCSDRDDQTLLWPGFPIRKSAGRRLFSASPRLIAAVHVLHRLLVPRHPPCALNILTEEHHFTVTMQISRYARSGASQLEDQRPYRRGLSKLSSAVRKHTIRCIHARSTYIPGFRIHRDESVRDVQVKRLNGMQTCGVGHRKSLERR